MYDFDEANSNKAGEIPVSSHVNHNINIYQEQWPKNQDLTNTVDQHGPDISITTRAPRNGPNDQGYKTRALPTGPYNQGPTTKAPPPGTHHQSPTTRAPPPKPHHQGSTITTPKLRHKTRQFLIINKRFC